MRFVCAFFLLVGSAFGQTVMDLSVAQGATKIITKEMGVVRPTQSTSNIAGTLIVQAGAKIEMPSNTWINLQWSGTIDFRGTQAEPINIYPASGATWYGFQNSYRTSASRPRLWMSWVNISGTAGSFSNSAIEVTYCNVLLNEVCVTTPRVSANGKALRAMNFWGGTTSTGVKLDCTGIVSNCKFIGSTTGVSDSGKSLVFDNCEALDVLTPFVWQPFATPQHFYQRFSVER